MTKPVFQTTRKERMGYYSYFLGQNIIYLFVTLFISIYYTTALGIPAAVVGTIILVARVWDAINDPMLAILVEKTNLKSGKFKPWIRSVAIAIPILTVLMFSFTDFLTGASLGVRITYATITYIIWGMTYTISDAPAFAMATIMTSDMDERNSVISFSRMFALIGILIAMVVGPQVVEATGGSYMMASVVLAVLALVFLLGINWSKERVKSEQKSPTLKDILQAIFHNKYLVIMVVTIVFMNGFNFGMTITPFVAADIFGDPGLTSIIMAASLLPMAIAAPLLPAVSRKFGKNPLMKFSLAVIVVFSIIIYFFGRESATMYIVLNLLKVTLSAFSMIIGSLYFADAIEYDYYRKGLRFEAAVFSAQTFSNKAMSAVAGAGAMYLISMFGYKESMAGEVVSQTAQAIDGVWITATLGPAVGAFIALIIFSLTYDLNEKKLKQMGLDAGYLKGKTEAA